MRNQTTSTKRVALLALLLQGFAAAACEQRESLSGPTPIGRTEPDNGVSIGGVVYDTATSPLAGARVEVIGGAAAGTSTITDAAGRFSLTGPFAVATRLAASIEGYLPATKTTVSGRPSEAVEFHLASAAVVGTIQGAFTLTVTADTACDALPAGLRTRTYGATVTLNPYWLVGTLYFDVSIGGSTFLNGFDSAERFYATVADDLATFGLGSPQGQPAFVERLSPTEYFAIGGAASRALPSPGSSFATPLAGYVEYCVVKSPADAPVHGYLYDCAPDKALTRTRCESTQHRLNWDRP
jgi:hypothetical protein